MYVPVVLCHYCSEVLLPFLLLKYASKMAGYIIIIIRIFIVFNSSHFCSVFNLC